jgi:hypothetical protein
MAALMVASISGLAACGDKEPTEPPLVAKTDTKVAMDPTVTSAVVGTTFSFPGGAGVFSSAVANQNLNLTFGGTASALTSAGTVTSPSGATLGTFTSSVSFGSCDFKITAVTGSPGVAVGDVVRVDPCTLNIDTAGQPTGTSENGSATLVFGTETSAPAEVAVTVDTNGTVKVNGTTVGTVTIGAGTGTTGA